MDMAGIPEQVARDFSLSALNSEIKSLRDNLKASNVDADDLEFDYESVKKAWEEYLAAQKALLSTIATKDDLTQEETDHNNLKLEFNALLKEVKKKLKVLRKETEPSKESLLKEAKDKLEDKKKHITLSIKFHEKRLNDKEVKLSTFHLDDIKVELSKLETYYESQVFPAYDEVIKLLMTTEKDKLTTEKDTLKAEMKTGLEEVRKKVWSMGDLVNERKEAFIISATIDTNVSSLPSIGGSARNPQSYHKKLDFPSFTSGQERDYPSFKRKWKATVTNSFPDSVQRDLIQERVPKEVEPEVKKAWTKFG